MGAGRMGIPTAYALKKLGHDVTVYDNNAINIAKSMSLLGSSGKLKDGYVSEDGIRFIDTTVNGEQFSEMFSSGNNPDVVVSALPFELNIRVAKSCIQEGVRYCDLGGDVVTSAYINKLAAAHATKPVATDQGLAPGFINIKAEKGLEYLKNSPYGVLMAVGGIPENYGVNPLNYICKWSTEGLINEYLGKANVILNGEKTKEDAMDGLQSINVRGHSLEAFYTSGGSSHTIDSMLDRGVKYCSYKTLRYPGHCELVTFLMNECGLSRDEFSKIINNGCKPQEGWAGLDMVVYYVNTWCDDGSSWSEENTIEAGSLFSAMQRATGYSIASVADLLTSGYLDDKKVVTYRDLNTPLYFKTFEKALKFDDSYEENDVVSIPISG